MKEKDELQRSIEQVDATLGMEGLHLTKEEKANLRKIMETKNASAEEISEIIKNIKPGESLLLKLYEEFLKTEKGKEKAR